TPNKFKQFLYICSLKLLNDTMSARGNSFKSNSFKQNTEPGKSGQRSGPKEPRVKSEYLPTFNLQDGRAVKIIGLFFIIVSVYFLVAFTSYLFTWEEDQSYVI